MPAATVRRLRTMPRLTRRGASLTVVGAVLVAISLWFDLRDVLLLAFVAIAMPLVALAYTALRLPRLAVTRSFAPATVTAGSSSRVRLVVQNRSRRTFDGASWRDVVPTALLGPAEAVLPAIGPWERMLPSGDDSVTLEYLLRTPRRGVYPIGPLRIALGDPFGLARMERDVGSAREFVVTPRVTELDHLVAANASVDGALRGLQRLTHPNSDELIAREYRYGDPLRRVNWPATARRGELMVREEEQRGDPEALLLLDTTLSGRPEAAWRHDDAPNFEFELAVEVAASLGVHLVERGFRLNCEPLVGRDADPLSFGATGEYRAPGGAGVLLDDLARLATPRWHRGTHGGDGAHGGGAEPGTAGHGGAAHGAHGGAAHGGRGERGTAAAQPARGIRSPHRGGARTARAHSALAGGREARMPGFVVLVQPDDEQLAALVAMRQAFSPAVALVLPPVAERQIEPLERADWRVLRVRRAADLAGAWSTRRPAGPDDRSAARAAAERSPLEHLIFGGDDHAP